MIYDFRISTIHHSYFIKLLKMAKDVKFFLVLRMAFFYIFKSRAGIAQW